MQPFRGCCGKAAGLVGELLRCGYVVVVVRKELRFSWRRRPWIGAGARRAENDPGPTPHRAMFCVGPGLWYDAGREQQEG